MSLFDRDRDTTGPAYGNGARNVSSPSTTSSISSLLRSSSLGSSSVHASQHMPKLVGDKYRLAEELGRGAFGKVYRAVDTQTGDSVAIKQLSLGRLGAEQLTGISKEVELLQALNHRNVVKYLGSYRTKTHLYIVMEFVENGALSAIIKSNKNGALSESLVAVYVQQVLLGLCYLHGQGVVHRDIKGANILTTKEGVVKLADFGVAAKLGDTDTLSGEDGTTPAGTPYWMAPEVVELKTVTTASDIWSVGCLAVELLTGQPPYFELQPMSALYNIVQDPHPPLPMGITSAMQDFLLQCFKKDPTSRPSAKLLLQHPWITSNRKVLRSTWTRSGKSQDQHSSVASVVERILAAESDDSTFSIDTNSPKSSVDIVHTDTETANELLAREDRIKQEEFLERCAADPRGTQLLRSFDGLRIAYPEASTTAANASGAFARGGGGAAAVASPHDEAEMTKQVMSLRILAPPGERNLQQEAAAAASARVLANYVRRDAALRAAFISADGISGVRELLDSPSDRVLFPTLDILCGLIESREPDIVDSLCLLGVLPAALRYTGPTFPPELRLQAGRLAEAMALSTQRGMHLLVACQGIPFFIGMIDDAPQSALQLELLRIAVASCLAILQQSRTPGWLLRTNQYLRLMAHHGLPLKLVRALPWVLKRSTEVINAYRTSQTHANNGGTPEGSNAARPTNDAAGYTSFRGLATNKVAPDNVGAVPYPQSTSSSESEGAGGTTKEVVEKLAALLESMINLFAAMSHGDTVVKTRMCQLETINNMFGLTTRMPPHLQLRSLQSVRRLASDPATLVLLEAANGIMYLVAQLQRNDAPILQAEALCALQSLCQLNRARQEKLATSGATPWICRLATQPFEADAVGESIAVAALGAARATLCALAHAGPTARAELWTNGGLNIFLDLLTDEGYQASGVEAIATWLDAEPERIEAALVNEAAVRQMVLLLPSSSTEDEKLQSVLSPLTRIVATSPRLAVALAEGGLANRVVDLLKRPSPRTALALLELLRVLYENQTHPKEFIIKYRVQPTLAALARGGTESEQILVRKQAQNLLKAFQVNSVF